MRPENLLLFADSERDADMLYAAGLFVPDPFVYLRLKGKGYLLLNDLELDHRHRDPPGGRFSQPYHCRRRPPGV